MSENVTARCIRGWRELTAFSGDCTWPSSFINTFASSRSQFLSKWRSLPEYRAFPINDIDCSHKQERYAEQNRAGVLEVSATRGADVRKEWRCWYCQDTSKEVSGPAIATCCRGGVRSICADHVVDGCHVNRVVGNTNDRGEDHRRDPREWRPLRSPCEANEADWQARSQVQQEVQSRLVLNSLIVWMRLTLLNVALDRWNEQDPRNNVADTDGNEGQSNLYS